MRVEAALTVRQVAVARVAQMVRKVVLLEVAAAYTEAAGVRGITVTKALVETVLMAQSVLFGPEIHVHSHQQTLAIFNQEKS